MLIVCQAEREGRGEERGEGREGEGRGGEGKERQGRGNVG